MKRNAAEVRHTRRMHAKKRREMARDLYGREAVEARGTELGRYAKDGVPKQSADAAGKSARDKRDDERFLDAVANDSGEDD